VREDRSHARLALTQRASLRELIARQPRIRAHELRAADTDPKTRMVREGELTRFSRTKPPSLRAPQSGLTPANRPGRRRRQASGYRI